MTPSPGRPLLLTLVNLTRGTTLAHRVALADNPIARMRGLLGRSSLPPGEGLWIRPCNSIHMFFMKFPIDALFLSRDMRAVRLVHRLRPWHLAGPVLRAWSVIELPEGTLALSGSQTGDVFESRPPDELN